MLDSQHLQEWRNSAVDEGIVNLNVRSLSGNTALNYLLYSDKLERLNTGRLASQWLKKYSFIELTGGWWCDGLDPLKNWQPMLWGCYKPDKPRLDFEKNKPIKYEHPPKTETRAFFLRVTRYIWLQVAKRFNIATPDLQAIKNDFISAAFWQWVIAENLPTIICEGAKKAGCLLSAGYVAVALPGITGGCRSRDQQGLKIEPRLNPELEILATPGRNIYICFDQDYKRSTRRNVNRETSKLGQCFTALQCHTSVINWHTPEKGVDDLIIARGVEAFDAAFENAKHFGYWQSQQLYSLTYNPSLRLSQRYLEEIPFPESGLVGIKSAKGTGKTQALEPLIVAANGVGRRVLVLTHRIQLGRAICQRLGLDWIEDLRTSETQGLLGYGLCVDSLHPLSQAKFNPEDWEGAIVVLDEVEQVIWHLLNSSTCREQRVLILETFTALIQTVLSTGGLVIAQDADLSDISIDYLRSLSEIPIEPFIVRNNWKPTKGWNVTFYSTKNAANLLTQIEKVAATGPVLIMEDSQKVKGKWSCRNLESQLKLRLPNLRILRIDSETVADPNHPAYGCVENINKVVLQYDIIIASPTINTGISINVRDYFKGVFGIFKGAISVNDVLQALARVRDENVPRFLWVQKFGLGKIGNGSANYRSILKSQQKVIKTNLRLLKDVNFDIDAATEPIHVRTWAQMAARINAGMWDYREAIWKKLVAEGHNVSLCRENQLQQQLDILHRQQLAANNAEKWELLEELEELAAPIEAELEELKTNAAIADTQANDVRSLNRHNEAVSITNGEDLDKTGYKQLKEKRSKTEAERHAERKYELKQRYGVDVNPELVRKDTDGWYPKIQLHYYLTMGREFLQLRDRKHLSDHLERGRGKVCPQDIRLLTAKIEVLEKLGFLQLLDGREYTNNSPEIVQIGKILRWCARDAKDYLGLTINPKMKDMELVQYLLSNLLQAPMKCIRQERTTERDARGRRKRQRVYQWLLPKDGRAEIFDAWWQRDTELMEKAASQPEEMYQFDTSVTGSDKYIYQPAPVTQPYDKDPVTNPKEEETILDAVGLLMASDVKATAIAVMECLKSLPSAIKKAIWALIPAWKRQQLKELLAD